MPSVIISTSHTRTSNNVKNTIITFHSNYIIYGLLYDFPKDKFSVYNYNCACNNFPKPPRVRLTTGNGYYTMFFIFRVHIIKRFCL